jgi:hypothetical protein
MGDAPSTLGAIEKTFSTKDLRFAVLIFVVVVFEIVAIAIG